jgi:hypothetical protein
MTALIVPTGLPAASGWALSDFRTAVVTTGPAAGGVATGTFEQLESNELWLIDRIVVSCTSTTDTVVRIYDTVVTPGTLLTGSDRANFDEADYPSASGVQLHPSRYLVAVWSGCSAGAVGTINVQFREMRQG